MRRFPIVIALLAALTMTGVASADGCYKPTYYAPYKPVVNYVVDKVATYYPKFVAVAPLVEMPTYSVLNVAAVVSAAPAPVVAAPAPAMPSESQQILAAVNGLGGKLDMVIRRQDDQETRIKAIEAFLSNGQVPPRGATPAPPQKAAAPAQAPVVNADVASKALVYYKKSCAACHDASTAADEGGGFTLLKDGKKVALTLRQTALMGQKLYKNQMPKPNNKHGIPQATDEEVGLVTADNPIQ